MRKILLLLAAVAFLGAACGSDNDNDQNGASNSDSTATTAADGGDGGDEGGGDSADLEAKLLRASDLPAGFSLADSNDDDAAGDEEDESSPSGCPELDALEDDVAEEEVEAEFERSNEATESAQFVNQGIERYDSTADADADFDKAVAAFNKCKSFSTTEDDGTVITGSFTPLSFPKLEDDTFAVRMNMTFTSEGESLNFVGSMVAVRSDDLVTLLMSLNYGEGALSAADFEAIVRKAADKL